MSKRQPPPEEEYSSEEPSFKQEDSGVHVESIENVDGDVNVANQIIQQIENFQQRALTPGEVVQKDLQIEVDLLGQGINLYLQGLKDQLTRDQISTPFKELQPYTLLDTRDFFGRDEDRANLYIAMQRARLTILQSESGAGKTSLLQAGIVPDVLAKDELAVLIRAQFKNPTEVLKRCFLGDLTLTPKLAAMPLVAFLRLVSSRLGQRNKLYLILDQFEEFFARLTLEADRQDFISDLAACLNDPTLNVRWLLSITSEALGQLVGKFEPQIRQPQSNVYTLSLFTLEQAREVIERNADRYGFSFEEDLLKSILHDLRNDQDEHIAPTQMQLVCTALYEDLPKDGAHFTRAHYERKGGVQAILQDYVGHVLRHKLPARERPAAYKILEELVTSEKKRVWRTKTQLAVDLQKQGFTMETVESTLDHLVSSRLLRRLGDDVEQLQFELVHDYLLKEIELDEHVIRLKQAEELLIDGIKAWRRNKRFLLGREQFSVIAAEVSKSMRSLDQEKSSLLFQSAAIHNRPTDVWLKGLEQKTVRGLIEQSLVNRKSTDPELRNRAVKVLWALRRHTPREIPASLYVQVLSQQLILNMPLILLVVVLTGTARLWLSTTEISEWQALHVDVPANMPTTNLTLALSPDDADEVYVSSQQADWVASSRNGGTDWITKTIADASGIHALATAQGSVYAVSDQFLFVSTDRGETWSTLETFSDLGMGTLEALAVNPRDMRQIFIGTSSGEIRGSSDGGKTWQAVSPDYEGKTIRALAMNARVLLAATDTGLWVYEMAEKTWNAVSLRGCDDNRDPSDRVTALAIPLASDATQIGFWAVIPGVGVCDSDYENEFETSVFTEGVPYLDIDSIVITGDTIRNPNIYLSTDEKIFRQRTWHWTDLEWWKIKLHL